MCMRMLHTAEGPKYKHLMQISAHIHLGFCVNTRPDGAFTPVPYPR